MGTPSQRARWLSVLVASLVGAWLYALPTLGAGRFLDDHAQLAMLEGRYPSSRLALDLFSFSRGPSDNRRLVAAGVLPWWSSTRWSLAMLRPLPSALGALDHEIFGRGTLGPRVHSSAWFFATLLAASGLLFSWLPTRAAALSTVLFSLSGAAVIPLGWLAGRNALVASCMVFWSVHAAHRVLQEPSARHAREAMMALVFASLSGEYALVALGPIALMALATAFRHGSRNLLILLYSFIILIPATLSRALHYGARDATAYLDPLADLSGWLREAPVRASQNLSWLLGARPMALIPTGLLLGLSALHLGAFALALRVLDATAQRSLMAFGAGSALALAPLLSAPPSSRLLLVPSLAISALVGTVLHASLSGTSTRPARWTLRALALPLVALHAILAPLVAHRESRGLRALFDASEAAHRELQTAVGGDAPSTLVLLRTDSLDTLHHTPLAFAESGLPMPPRWRVLTFGAGPLLALRTADDTLELRSLEGPLVSPSGELYRPRDGAFHTGERVIVPGMTVTVLEVLDGLPRRLRVSLERGLDDPSLRWICHVQGRFVRARIPAIHGAALFE